MQVRWQRDGKTWLKYFINTQFRCHSEDQPTGLMLRMQLKTPTIMETSKLSNLRTIHLISSAARHKLIQTTLLFEFNPIHQAIPNRVTIDQPVDTPKSINERTYRNVKFQSASYVFIAQQADKITRDRNPRRLQELSATRLLN